ncbi:hypothetical protein F4809DRAFT_306748 [Biscogniauxia mediterranea]|nr:hypothetical protein F4809DRAFT_306748 [Biscogniauxia mediterranea]
MMYITYAIIASSRSFFFLIFLSFSFLDRDRGEKGRVDRWEKLPITTVIRLMQKRVPSDGFISITDQTGRHVKSKEGKNKIVRFSCHLGFGL